MSFDMELILPIDIRDLISVGQCGSILNHDTHVDCAILGSQRKVGCWGWLAHVCDYRVNGSSLFRSQIPL